MKRFDLCLKDLFAASGVNCKELAHHLDVSEPVVKRWMNGNGLPDIYQFRGIARFFQIPYEWFLDDGDNRDCVEILGERLGLSKETAESLLEITVTESEDIRKAVDDAVYSLLTILHAKEQAEK